MAAQNKNDILSQNHKSRTERNGIKFLDLATWVEWQSHDVQLYVQRGAECMLYTFRLYSCEIL